LQIIETLNSTKKFDLPEPLKKSNINSKMSNLSFIKNCIDRQITVSPDLFESESEETIDTCKTQENKYKKANEYCTNLIMDVTDENIKQMKINESSVNYPKNVKNSKSENEILFNLSPLEDIYQAVTPKQLSPNNCDKIILENYDYDKIHESFTPPRRSSEKYTDIISNKETYKIDEITEAVTPKRNILSDLNDCITPIKAVYTNILPDDIIDEKLPENDNLIHTSITPPKSNNSNFKLNKENLHQVKSNLSLFLDKIHKENAKGILDTDSDTDSPEIKIKKQNPFLKKNQNDSFGYLFNDEIKNLNHKCAISMIEKDVLEEEENVNNINKLQFNLESEKNKSFSNKNETYGLSTNRFSNSDFHLNLHDTSTETNSSKLIENSNLLSSKALSPNMNVSNNLTSTSSNDENDEKDEKDEQSINFSINSVEFENTTINETKMSMYSRYKKLNQHNNSIDKYRKQLDFNASTNISKTILSQTDYHATPNPIIHSITLISDSDEEEEGNNLKRVINEEKICNQTNSITCLDKSMNEQKLLSDTTLSNIINDFNESSTSIAKNTFVSKNNKKNNVFNSTLNTDKNTNNQLPYSIAENLNDSPEQCDKIEYEKRLQISEKINDDVDAEIRKILESSPNFETNGKNTNDKNENKNKMINISPISIISSPEIFILENKNLNKTDVDDFKIFENSNNKEDIEFNLIESNLFNKKEFNKRTIRTSPQKNMKNESELRELFTDANGLKKNLNSSFKSKNAHILHLTSSPIVCKNRQNSKKDHILYSESNSNEDEHFSSSVQFSKENKKFKTKSVSAVNLIQKEKEFKKCNLQKSSSFTTPKQNKKLVEKFRKEDITPPKDYNLLGTPDLEVFKIKIKLERKNYH
jgi:hypothetical protein